MAWALLFAVTRRVVESDTVMRSGRWPGWGPLQFIGGDIRSATLGIVRAGRIGTAMAHRSVGFGMPILYTDTRPNPVLEAELAARYVSFDELISQGDFVSIHVPLMAETRHLFTYATFQRMKRTVFLINTARGPIVKEDDLVRALNDRMIAGTGLDVYEHEPRMAPGLADCVNAVLCPHTASATVASYGQRHSGQPQWHGHQGCHQPAGHGQGPACAGLPESGGLRHQSTILVTRSMAGSLKRSSTSRTQVEKLKTTQPAGPPCSQCLRPGAMVTWSPRFMT
jgi:hypothetical protein